MTDLLFFGNMLNDVLSSSHQALYKEIDSLPEDQVLNTSQADLCAYFIEKYSVDPVIIDKSGIQVDYGDAQIDVAHRFDYAVYDGSSPTYVTGTRIAFFIPFAGDRALLRCQPSTCTFNPPRASIRNSEVLFVYDRTSQETSTIKGEFATDFATFKKYIAWIADDVKQFNSGLAETIGQRITARRDKLLNDRGMVADLGFPLKRGSDVQKTYVTPEMRRRIAPRLPKPSREHGTQRIHGKGKGAFRLVLS